MACKTSYELHHNFPKLAEEAGFTFNLHRPRIRTDWNKIRLIEIESLIRDRKYALIEQHVNDILDCVLESEFDVRILDEGVVKMFRLAQLAVEYQQFCRHYLDRSVYVLREEITSIVQELDATKKDLRDKIEEIRKIKKKPKNTFRPSLQYGNDNIATMILKTLANKSDMFPSTSNGDMLQYNKCSYCDKVFMNQLYLKSHITRRHTSLAELPQKDLAENVQIINNPENTKLNDEITELKLKLQEMESIIIKTNNPTSVVPINNNNQTKAEQDENVSKEMKDAEAFTNNEDFLLEKIEEWKKEEREKYSKEISLLRTQIFESINSLKQKEDKPAENEFKIIAQLHLTIKQQGDEILSLKEELVNSKLKSENEVLQRKKEAEDQMLFWAKRTEAQSKQYELLLQKLNELSKEAHESRTIAEDERRRAMELQTLLEQNLKKKSPDKVDTSTNPITVPIACKEINKSDKKKITDNKYFEISKTPNTGRKTLEELHRKAQELLNIGSINSSDTSSDENIKSPTATRVSKNNQVVKKEQDTDKTKNYDEKNKRSDHLNNHVQRPNKNNTQEIPKPKERKLKKGKSKYQPNITINKENGPVYIAPGSPMKVLRAKITEEVNNRMVSVGIDPFKSKLAPGIFQRQRMQLQQQQEIKFKKNPAYEKVKHSILAYLDSNTPDLRSTSVTQQVESTKPRKTMKGFSFTSVISNVKNKALSLVKQNEITGKTINTEVTRRALSLIKTPPGSATSSLVDQDSPIKRTLKSELEQNGLKPKRNNALDFNASTVKGNKNHSMKTSQAFVENKDSDTDTNSSEHKYYNNDIEQSSKSIENLIKSPARRPASADATYDNAVKKYTIGGEEFSLVRAKSATDLSGERIEINNTNPNSKVNKFEINENSSDDVESLTESPNKKAEYENNQRNSPKQTKGVLKNASSTSSLNKKKVIFDMDAIQMKSVSASPSQSLTEKSGTNEKYELGLVNLDDEEWDISSIDNEPLKNDTKIQNNSRTSPKIAELKNAIESQLARRNGTPTGLVGRVDVLRGPLVKSASVGGSNTSLGSSILDESESSHAVKSFVKLKKATEKEDSELDISEFSVDKFGNKIENESF